MEKVKINTLEDLIKLKNEGKEIIYENYLNDGIVRRVEQLDGYYLVVVKLNSNVGITNLSEFKFYKKPKDVHLSSFYYNKVVPLKLVK